MMIDYNELANEVIGLLEEIQTIILATCTNERVTARTMNMVNDGLTIYFQTGKNGDKGKQVCKNPNVAIAVDNIQIEAVARFTDNTNEIALCSTKYKAKYPRLYEKYFDFPEEPTLICEPTIIKLYKFIDGKICFDVLDVKDKKAYRL
jgi:general stress protein 26